jgi:uncharacterized membrane protein
MMSGNRTRWLLLAFGISLLLNLFMAGIVTGRWTFPGIHLMATQTSNGLIARARVRDLPEVERRAFNAVMKRHIAEIKSAHQKVRSAREAVTDAISMPHYDRKVMEAKFAEVRRALLVQQTLQQDAIAEALGVLNASSRASIAEGSKEDLAKSP